MASGSVRHFWTVLAVALIVFAIGLWLSGGPIAKAATQNQTQGVSTTVDNAVQWGTFGSGPTGCTQAMGAQAFPNTAPGGSQTSSLFTGCVDSNATWDVTASMTTTPKNGGTEIPASAFSAYVTTPPTGVVPSCLLATPCAFGSSQTLINDAAATPITGPTLLTNSFTYNLKMTVPAGQPAGSYTGGVVTFVASN